MTKKVMENKMLSYFFGGNVCSDILTILYEYDLSYDFAKSLNIGKNQREKNWSFVLEFAGG